MQCKDTDSLQALRIAHILMLKRCKSLTGSDKKPNLDAPKTVSDAQFGLDSCTSIQVP